MPWTVVRVILALFGGVLASIGVAWKASTQKLTVPPVLGPPCSAYGKYVPAAVYRGRATELVYIDWYGIGPDIDTQAEPVRADWYPERSAKHASYTCIIAQASGWPLYCMWREHLKSASPAPGGRKL